MLRRLALGLALGLGLAAQAPPAGFVLPGGPEALPAPLAKALEGLQTPALSRHLAYLTAPERQGRGLGTRGLQTTADYVTAHLAKAGLAPLGKSYDQPVPLREIRKPGGGVSLRLGGVTVTWRHGVTCLLPELEPQLLSGAVVFVGYGIQEPALNHDDFQGLDVRGKIVLLVGGLPPLPGWQTPELQAKYGGVKPQDRYAARLELLDHLGAKAVIALEAGLPGALATSPVPAEPFFRAAAGVPYTDEPPLVRAGLAQAAPLLAALGVNPAQAASVRPSALQHPTATLRFTGTVQPASSRNVLAVLPGADPSLASEAVILGAHMDHLGMKGGVLHPGADDNASGVSALLEIAQAFANAPARPRRTVIFAFWTGEEDGKFGSGHYVRHPRWPLPHTTAYLNLDMIGHPWTPEELRKLVLEAAPQDGDAYLAQVRPQDFAEPGFAQGAPWLGPILARAGRGTGLALHLDPGDGINGGSDYRDFARARVPWVRFFGNYFPGYHEPSDTAERLDPAQVQRMARLALASAWLLATP